MNARSRHNQPLRDVLLCSVLILWISALALYISGYLVLGVISSTLSILFFFCYLTNIRTKLLSMFGKKTSKYEVTGTQSQSLTSNVSSTVSGSESKVYSDSIDVRNRCTIIARNASFVGDIEDSGDIQIYGKIVGNINITEGSIRIMNTGYVKGQLNAPEIIIDGQVHGSCYAENIDILEHGMLRGTSCCENISIKRGGVFVGQSEEWTPKEVPLTRVTKDVIEELEVQNELIITSDDDSNDKL